MMPALLKTLTPRMKVSTILLLMLTMVAPSSMLAADKKGKKNAAASTTAAATPGKAADTSHIVWPAPPSITRVKYLDFFAGEKIDPSVFNAKAGSKSKKKSGWMERVAGTQTEQELQDLKPRFVLVEPYGMAVDSKGRLYVADQKVGAIFIFNTETRDVELIKNGNQAHFGQIIGLTIDDSDTMYVSDNKMHRILVFNPQHSVIGMIDKGLMNPGGMAVDNKNRLLYVADLGLDQVLVFDSDTLKPLRKIGTTGKGHTLTDPGDFAKPSNVAVDREGNVYVSDTLNNRVEIFDADGNFVSTFGKNGDGPGYFARPKGIAIDKDGHIWVADGMLDRLQVFDKQGQLLTYMGGHGNLPGQFAALCGVTIDNKNRVFTSEVYPGRVQEFRYITEAEASQEQARRDAELKKRSVKTENQATGVDKDEAAATKRENPSGK